MKRLLLYFVLVTWLLAMMDWKPIHHAWWHYGAFPSYAGNWQKWSMVRMWTAWILCPPCGAAAEHYYYVLMDIEAGTDEQAGVLKAEYSGNPFLPHGPYFYWGQGEGREWRRVSILDWWLYHVPVTLIWWYGWKFVFRLVRKSLIWRYYRGAC